MSKETVLLLLDVGSSMYEPYSKVQNKTRLDIGIECIKMHLQQKIFYGPNHEVGLMLFGAEESPDGNTLYVREFDKTDFEFIRNVTDLSSHDKAESEKGDIFDALQKGISILDDFVKKKKQTKKIFLITNGSGDTSYTENDIRILAKQAEKSDTRINIIVIDFLDSNKNQSNAAKIEEGSQNQGKNEEFLQLLCSTCTAKVFSASQAMEIYKQLRTKSMDTRTKLRVPMEITSNVQIEIMVYSKTSEQRLPTLKKFSTVAPFNRDAKSAEIMMERKYYVFDDPNMEKVDPEYKIKGYYYGKQLVPVSKILEESLKFPTEKCLKILGFIPKERLFRHYFIGTVDMVSCPNQCDANQQKFNALIDGMVELSKVGLARYVTRANAPPRLAALIPTKKEKKRFFWLVILPTIEDIRDFQFPSLKESTKEQQDAAEKFIDAMDLSKLKDENEEVFEGLKPNSTFNPVLQNFYQFVVQKVVENKKSDEIPKLDPIMNDYIHPENKLYKVFHKEINDFKTKFSLKEIEQKKAGGEKVFWRQLIEQQKVKQESASTIDQSDTRSIANLDSILEEERIVKHKKFNFADDEDRIVRNISPMNPLEDFKSMITNKNTDLVDDALKQIKILIMRYVNESLQGSFYKKAVDCLREMRKGCVSEEEVDVFNGFMMEIREKFSFGNQANFWREVVKQGISLITNSECLKSKITAKEAAEFLIKQEAAEIEEKGGKKDLMDEIE